MRIGIEAQRVFRKEKHGMDIVVLELIRNLQKQDKTNQYFIFANEGPDTACLKETENFDIITFGGSYPVWEQVKLPVMAKKYRCDILHCTSNTAPIKWHGPLVVTIHDIIYFEKNPLFVPGYTMYQRLGNLYRRLVVRKNIRQARRIITVSEFEKKQFVYRLGLSPEKIEVVYNAAGSHFFEKPNKDETEKVISKLRVPRPYILFLGNTDPKKNTKSVLKAFRQLCQGGGFEHTLVVPDFALELAQKYLGREFQNRLLSLKYIPNGELPHLLAEADLFLYPSLRESFGIPIVEAMAAGAPVITSDAASMPEVAGGAAVLVNPNDPREIAKAIREILADKQKQAQMRAKGAERARYFSWGQTAQKTLAVYQKVFAEIKTAL